MRVRAWAGLDVGTSKIKAVAWAPDSAEPLSFAESSTPWAQGVLDPMKLMDVVHTILGQSVDRLGPSVSLAAIGITSFGEAGLFVDGDGSLGPMVGWQDLSQTAVIYRRFAQEFNRMQVFSTTGIAPSAKFGLFRMVAQSSGSGGLWLQAADFVAYALTGGARVTHANLAARTMAYDFRRRDWDPQLLAWAKMRPDQLPQVLFQPEVAGRWQQVPWPDSPALVVHAGQDHGAAYYGARLPLGQVLDSSGTAEPWVLGLNAPILTEASLAAGMMWAANADDTGYLGLLPNPGGGAAERWARGIFGTETQSAETGDLRFHAEGFLEGQASFSGMSANTTAGGFYFAVLDGVAEAMGANLGRLRDIAQLPLADVAWCGGAVHHPAWTAIRRRRISSRIWTLIPAEGALMGALRAALAASRAGYELPIEFTGPESEVGRPQWIKA